MRKTSVLLIVLLTLALGSSVVWAVPDHAVIPRDRGIFIELGKGKPGHLVTKEDVLPLVTLEFRAELDSVLAGSKRLVVVCCTDPTKYGVLEIFRNDPRFKDIDFDAQNLDWDGATNGAREATANQVLGYIGMDPLKVPIDYFHIRSQRIGDRYIHIYVDMLPTKPTERIVVEHTVTERVIEKTVETIVIECGRHDLNLAFMGGLRSTEFAVAPTVDITLTLNNRWLAQGWGMHSAFLRNERDTFTPDTETLDQGGGIRVGTRAYKSLWVLGGAFIEENVLTKTPYAGKRPWWYTGADLSIALRRPHYALVVSGTYGHKWDFSNDRLDTQTDIRFAIVAGDTWRLK